MFSDSDRFRFVEMCHGGPLFPVHHRPLGVKVGRMYDKTVRWADVVINDVSLEKTFEHEDIMNYISSQRDDDNYERGVMIVNSRDYVPEKVVLEDYGGKYDSAYRRLQNMKISPMTFKQAKKKKPSKDKYSSKSKGNLQKHMVEKEKSLSFNKRFKDVVSTNDLGILTKNIMHIEGRNCSHMQHCTNCKTFVPPIHWIEPIKRWDLIWSAMDEMENGRKRDYHYLEPGLEGEDGIVGPAIYFYDKDHDDINYSFDWRKDFIYGELDVERTPMWYNRVTKNESPHFYDSFVPTRNISPNFKEFPGWGWYDYCMSERILSLSGSSASAYALDEYLMNPNDFTYSQYLASHPLVWKNGVIGYYRERGSEIPTPHL